MEMDPINENNSIITHYDGSPDNMTLYTRGNNYGITFIDEPLYSI